MTKAKRARPTTPTTEFVEVDDSRTYLCFGAFGRSVLGFTDGHPRALVLLDLTGKWNHGDAFDLSLVLSPETAREIAELLMEAAAAADKDLQTYLKTGKAT